MELNDLLRLCQFRLECAAPTRRRIESLRVDSSLRQASAQNDNKNAEGFWLVILSKAKDLRGAMRLLGSDQEHSGREERFYALGQTDAGRLLFLVFTVRGSLIRLISARDMSRKERRIYRSS